MMLNVEEIEANARGEGARAKRGVEAFEDELK